MALSEITQLLTGRLVLPAKEVMNQLQDIEKQDIKQNSELKQLNYTAKEILKYLKPSLDDLETRLEKNKVTAAASAAAASAGAAAGGTGMGGGGLGSILGGVLTGAGGAALLSRIRSMASRNNLRANRLRSQFARQGDPYARARPPGTTTSVPEVRPVIIEDPVRGPVIAEEPVVVGRAPVVMSEGPVMSPANVADDAVRIRPVWDDALGRYRNPTTGRIMPTALADELIMAAESTRPAQLTATREAPPRPTNSRGALVAEQRFFAQTEASLGSRMTGMAKAGGGALGRAALGLPGLVAQLVLTPSEIELDPQEQLHVWTRRQFEERGVGAIPDVLEMLSAYEQEAPEILAMSGVGNLLNMGGEELRELAKSYYRIGSNPNYAPSIAYSDTNAIMSRAIRDYTTDAEGFALSPDTIRSKLRADADRVAGGAYANGGVVINNINNNGGGNSAPVVIPPAEKMPSTVDSRFSGAGSAGYVPGTSTY